MTDVVIPGDSNIRKNEKIEKYQGLKLEHVEGERQSGPSGYETIEGCDPQTGTMAPTVSSRKRFSRQHTSNNMLLTEKYPQASCAVSQMLT